MLRVFISKPQYRVVGRKHILSFLYYFCHDPTVCLHQCETAAQQYHRSMLIPTMPEVQSSNISLLAVGGRNNVFNKEFLLCLPKQRETNLKKTKESKERQRQHLCKKNWGKDRRKLNEIPWFLTSHLFKELLFFLLIFPFSLNDLFINSLNPAFSLAWCSPSCRGGAGLWAVVPGMFQQAGTWYEKHCAALKAKTATNIPTRGLWQYSYTVPAEMETWRNLERDSTHMVTWRCLLPSLHSQRQWHDQLLLRDKCLNYHQHLFSTDFLFW